MSIQKFGITEKKLQNFAEWYTQVVLKSELLDYYDIKGCYIMRPLSQFIWKQIQKTLTEEIEKLGVEECYFPMLIPKTAFEKEKKHIENFSSEVSWITRCGDTDLDSPVAVRPTSETIMYPSFSKWLRSHRDLPLKLNQWCSVLRWEVRSTTPFIRGREFLWQEGHTAHLNREDADKEVLVILDLYAKILEDLLAVPVIKGRKSENEKFGGADYTTSIEAFIPGTGRGVQAATSHSLGTNFSKMFNIRVETENEDLSFVYQNSWGLTTRTIGIAAMLHSDDKGLVLPPKVAQIQVILVQCGISSTTTKQDRELLDKYVEEAEKELINTGIRTKVDGRTNLSPGYKFNHWEIRGVPLRLEVGYRELKNEEFKLVRRDTGFKKQVSRACLGMHIRAELEQMHNDMLNRAVEERDKRLDWVTCFEDFVSSIKSRNLVMAPWCENSECEESIKKRTTTYDGTGCVIGMGAKTLCIPFGTKSCEGMQCVGCKTVAKRYTLFGRSY